MMKVLLIICRMLDFSPPQYSEHTQYLTRTENLTVTKIFVVQYKQKGTNKSTLVVVLNPFNMAVSGCGCGISMWSGIFDMRDTPTFSIFIPTRYWMSY